jgi:Zn-dependent M28 family amino/carboxypeptidase
MGWTRAVPQTTARVVDIGDGTAAEFAKAGNVAGAVLLVHNKVLEKWEDLFDEYMRAPAILDQGVKAKALALAFISSREHDVLYRHINAMHGTMDPIPEVLLAREDGLRIARLLAHGKAVKMNISVPNKIGPPITTQNVVAELKGSELPNEQVIIGAHLDSWDLGTGALDNGCNAALVIDALRAIKAAGVKPRRTIRFILFGGEEQGMLGSWAYIKAHQNELDNVVGEVVIDSGIGAFTGFSTGGRKDLDAPLQPMLAPFAQYKATEITNDASLGTDNFDFMLEGVPTVTPNQVEANYLKNYHASSDTFDKVDFEQLKKNEAILTELIVELANGPRIGPRLTRAQIEETFKESHLDEQMKGFDVWEDWASGRRGRKQ